MPGRLVESTLHEVVTAFAAAAPTPGGGSASAAAAAMGVALLRKAAALAGFPQHTLAGIEAQLVDAIDDDAVAYQLVIAARRQPRDSQAERALRLAGIQRALRRATDVPLGIMRLSSEALAEAHSLAPRIHRSAVADATVAVRLLRAGFEGAHVTVDANLDGVVDADYVRTVREECGRLCERAARGSEEAERLLRV